MVSNWDVVQDVKRIVWRLSWFTCQALEKFHLKAKKGSSSPTSRVKEKDRKKVIETYQAYERFGRPNNLGLFWTVSNKRSNQASDEFNRKPIDTANS